VELEKKRGNCQYKNAVQVHRSPIHVDDNKKKLNLVYVEFVAH